MPEVFRRMVLAWNSRAAHPVSFRAYQMLADRGIELCGAFQAYAVATELEAVGVCPGLARYVKGRSTCPGN